MTISQAGAARENSIPSARAKRLLLAMSPTNTVLKTFCSHSSDENDTSVALLGTEKQDSFATMVESCWNEFGPSNRYMKRLIMQFVRLAEKNGCEIDSDALANLVAQASFVNTDGPPDTLESCYLSFFMDDIGIDDDCLPLRIRVFPDHNDVALRLWEAGNCLAEFFIENPSIIAGKALIELGSGCGATGLAIAACCQPSKVHLTDYTAACRLNLEHNLLVNHEWLSRYNFSPERMSQGYLEWGAFVKDYEPNSNDGIAKKGAAAFDDTMKAFSEADILIAADVIYDIASIDSLLNVVKCFLMESPKSKQAIFATTRRNMATFEFFLETIEKYDMFCTWLARNEDCDALTKVFEGNYLQGRHDVQICRIHMTDFEECTNIAS
eukprot:jgi/Psemu1/301130/fgenesh1_kg.26_\